MRLIKPEEQRAEARKRASAREAQAGIRARWLIELDKVAKDHRGAAAKRIAREKAIEAEAAKYINLVCGHCATREGQEFHEDRKHPGLFFCETCFFVHPDFLTEEEAMEASWKEAVPPYKAPPLPDEPPF